MLRIMSPQVKAVVPVLPAAEVAASLAWWTGVCGFSESFRDATPPRYAGIARDGAELHLAEVTDQVLARRVGDQTMVRIQVDDVASMYAEY
jgi:hypothetical protein